MDALAISDARLVAQLVPEHQRLQVLPRHFGRHMLIVEQTVYCFMMRLSPDYQGSYWHYYELSNGGFYMAPHGEKLRICVEGNGFEGEMSTDAAGITVCLFTFSDLSFRIDDEAIAQHYHLLRDFALEHSEAAQILSAVD
jgi:hypothetical protein